MSDQVRIRVDRELCVGSASCVASAPQRFVLEEGLSSATTPTASLDDDLRDAAEGCPVMAITLFDVETGEEVW